MNHNRILFITTKNVDYLRNVQEIRLLKEKNAEVTVIGSHSRKYLNRLFYVYRRLLTVKASDYGKVFIGFAPQLVLPFWKKKFRKNTVVIDFFISMYDTLVNDRKVFSLKNLKNIDYVVSNNDEDINEVTKKVFNLYKTHLENL